jgi:hypothetical protein
MVLPRSQQSALSACECAFKTDRLKAIRPILQCRPMLAVTFPALSSERGGWNQLGEIRSSPPRCQPSPVHRFDRVCDVAGDDAGGVFANECSVALEGCHQAAVFVFFPRWKCLLLSIHTTLWRDPFVERNLSARSRYLACSEYGGRNDRSCPCGPSACLFRRLRFTWHTVLPPTVIHCERAERDCSIRNIA